MSGLFLGPMGDAVFFSITLFAALVSPASAHMDISSHETRHGRFELKQGPCGKAETARGENVYTYVSGQTITLEWQEYINHPAHYRVAFDSDGIDDFVEPASIDDFYSNEAVLMDAIADNDGGDYSVQVTLPDVVCDSCTLQLIQVMYDKPPYGDGNDIYSQCVDLILVAPEDAAGVVIGGPEPSQCGCAAQGAPSGFFAMIPGFLLVLARRGDRSRLASPAR